MLTPPAGVCMYIQELSREQAAQSAPPPCTISQLTGRIQSQLAVRRYLCSSVPWRAASPESPGAPALWTAPSSALSSPAAPASLEPARCQSPLWAGPAPTHTPSWVYKHRDIQQKRGGGGGSRKKESDVGSLSFQMRRQQTTLSVTAVLGAAHSGEAACGTGSCCTTPVRGITVFEGSFYLRRTFSSHLMYRDEQTVDLEGLF